MGNNERVKEHFEAEADSFDKIIIQLIPYYQQMVGALVLSIPFPKSEPIRVLDLGCGTGTITSSIKNEFPNAKITCLDIAANMIRVAQSKLSQYRDVHYHTGDFNDYQFDQTFEVIVSSLALHHLPDDAAKVRVYRKIFGSLTTGGVFYNADAVLGSNDFLQANNMQKWQEYMNRTVPMAEIENQWMVTYREEDRPARLMSHLEWLREVGFKDVDVVWKYYNFAVYGGVK
jgi:tRNA (cmo5U34)-methyltransferase